MANLEKATVRTDNQMSAVDMCRACDFSTFKKKKNIYI